MISAKAIADVEQATRAALGVSLTDPIRAAAFDALSNLLDDEPLHVLSVEVRLQYLADPNVLPLDQMSFSQIGTSVDVRPLAVSGEDA